MGSKQLSDQLLGLPHLCESKVGRPFKSMQGEHYIIRFPKHPTAYPGQELLHAKFIN